MIIDILSIYLLAGLIVTLLFFRDIANPFFSTPGRVAFYIASTIVCWPYASYLRLKWVARGRP